MKREVVVLFILVFAIILYKVNLDPISPTGAVVSNSLTCRTSLSCSSTERAVMKLSSDSNAHGSDKNSNYQYSVCCSPTDLIGTDCGTTALKLSSIINAHAEKATYSNYLTNICLSSQGTLECHYEESSGSCTSGTCLVTMSSGTNAHLASCSRPYKTTVCCSASYTGCRLDLVSLESECSGGSSADCELNEKIKINAYLSYDCSTADSIIVDTTGPCNLQLSSTTSISPSTSSFTADWPISFNSSCAGSYSVNSARLVKQGATIANTNSATGSFTLKTTNATVTTTTTSTTLKKKKTTCESFNGVDCQKEAVAYGWSDFTCYDGTNEAPYDTKAKDTNFCCTPPFTCFNPESRTEIIIVQECSDRGDGTYERESKIITRDSEGRIVEEKYEKQICTQPPKVPFFDWISLVLTVSILISYYIYEKTKKKDSA